MTKKELKRQEQVRREMKRIKDRERRFRAMPLHRKRMAIARDVINQILAKKLDPKTGSWLNADVPAEMMMDKDVELQRAIVMVDHCTACAVGAVFACAVLRQDDFKVMDGLPTTYGLGDEWSGNIRRHHLGKVKHLGIDFDGAQAYLNGLFSGDQLLLIEAAFEQGGTQGQSHIADYHRAVNFGKMFDDDGARMIAIMENIIANEGTFRPLMGI